MLRRATTKYWVAPEHVMRVQAYVIRHLPLLVFGRPEGGPVGAATEQATTSSNTTSAAQIADGLLTALRTKGPRAEGAHANPSSRISR